MSELQTINENDKVENFMDLLAEVQDLTKEYGKKDIAQFVHTHLKDDVEPLVQEYIDIRDQLTQRELLAVRAIFVDIGVMQIATRPNNPLMY